MNMPAQTTNSFGAHQQASNAVANSDSQRAVAEVQAAMMIARMNPRNEKSAIDRILNSCSRPSLAECAVYQYSKGGTDVSGPSIRLAEAMAQQWGNFQFGIRELDQRNGESTVQAFAWDVETNTKREITFQVPHTRYTRAGGNKPISDPREIYELVANQGSRRLRACILAIIPGDVAEMATKQCELTLKASADTSPEAMQKMIDAFTPFGVSKEQIEARIQRRIEAITAAQVVGLKKIYASLRDGMSVSADWFDASDSPVQTIASKPLMSDEAFKVELPKWEKIIASGKKTADEIIATASTKSSLSEDQIIAIKSIAGPTNSEAEVME